MSAHTPGPWVVSPYSGGEGYRQGFYVMRQVGARSEWFCAKASGRVRHFKTVWRAKEIADKLNLLTALNQVIEDAAIAKTTGAA